MRWWKPGVGSARLSWIVILVSIGFGSSCSEAPLDPGPAPFMRAHADMTVWEADDLPRTGWAVAEVYSFTPDSRELILRGIDRREYGSVEIRVRVLDYGGPGTYVLGSPDSGSYATFKIVALDGTTVSWYRTARVDAGEVVVEREAREGTDFGLPLQGISGRFHFAAQKFDGLTEVTASDGLFRGRYIDRRP